MAVQEHVQRRQPQMALDCATIVITIVALASPGE
jgi:hypothetical protein